jgi:hypothetical protein
VAGEVNIGENGRVEACYWVAAAGSASRPSRVASSELPAPLRQQIFASPVGFGCGCGCTGRRPTEPTGDH